MKKYDPSLFFTELRSSIEQFYSSSGSTSLCQISDFIYSLQGIVSVLLRTNDDCANPDHLLALEALETVGHKLSQATEFRDLLGTLLGLSGKRHREERQELLEQLASLIRFCYMNVSIGRK